MTDKHDKVRFAEIQQQWHGWGSPVGLGIGILCAGAFIALAAFAESLFL